ncbi:MAG: Serine/threonine-protein kinase PknD [Fimbriimonadaceae bacterium]|nr:Serine/threonine-protein kinase PknD [Fimbriimonadaceae bacterium]
MSQTPTTLGKYQIIREIARSNDIVYEAYDPVMNRRVALKELAVPSGSTDQQKEDRKNRFLREARAAGSLTHPNIVTIFEFGEEAGRFFIAMEYLDGRTLRNELDTHGFLPQDRALHIADEVLKALDYAHNHGVIHRDIKPENIQLCESGAIKLTDFGIARLTFEPNLTMDGQVFGTPSYMSPEQVVGRDIDARSDIFSVGVVMYEMLSGQKPFAGDSVVTITYAIMNKTPDVPAQANHAVWQVVERAIEKSSALRFSSAGEMRQAVDQAIETTKPGAVVLPNLGNPTMMPYPQQPMPYPYPPTMPTGMPVAGPPPQHPYPYPNYPMPPTPYGYPQQQQAPPPYLPPGVYQPGMPVAPIYYPPLPRPPLLKPATKAFLVRFFGALILLVTLFVLLLSALNSVSKIVEQQRLQEEARARGLVPGGGQDAEQERVLSAVQAKLLRAKTMLASDPSVARRLAEEIVADVPNHFEAYLLIGDSYRHEAQGENGSSNWTKAARAWREAMKYGTTTGDTESRARDALRAIGDIRTVDRRAFLHDLKTLCPMASETFREIDSLLR